MTKPAPKILIIEWYDPHEIGDGWEEHVPGSMKGSVAVTVGLLVEETEEGYILGFNGSEDGEWLRKGLVQKTHIRRMKEMKYPWKSIGSALPRKKKVVENGS